MGRSVCISDQTINLARRQINRVSGPLRAAGCEARQMGNLPSSTPHDAISPRAPTHSGTSSPCIHLFWHFTSIHTHSGISSPCIHPPILASHPPCTHLSWHLTPHAPTHPGISSSHLPMLSSPAASIHSSCIVWCSLAFVTL
ncbi:hypothetical protein Pmani_036460 [Petrolisthes manimaculis]|uniref:Uncharacterized protein n=1 Tax=Petrolisthes manimaculis TaxID=1843537 RepID=A0AAE1TMN5_9EUCA|nr:hypothetical protein Pmani_036460 [Petrolisthes manimaculis]